MQSRGWKEETGRQETGMPTPRERPCSVLCPLFSSAKKLVASLSVMLVAFLALRGPKSDAPTLMRSGIELIASAAMLRGDDQHRILVGIIIMRWSLGSGLVRDPAKARYIIPD
ncbi:hypothetical protein BDN70DRAFT_899558 [Pholiota conissans]|uniref:Uncharacterized protein n=1 Tax=Pholiota conissans TaxID=109636 RepID=A0A9P5YTV5_9AGAR|nr:hypothetical protein BDN70DRAFT_899558 [Pholiota conissans]